MPFPSDVIDAAVGDRRSPWTIVCATLVDGERPTPIELAGKTVALTLYRDGEVVQANAGPPTIEVEPEAAVEVDVTRGLLRLTDAVLREQTPPAGAIVRLTGTTLPRGLTTSERYAVAPERSGWWALRSLSTGQIVSFTSSGSAVKVAVVGSVSYRPAPAAVDRASELRGVVTIADAEGRLTSFPARQGFRVRVSDPGD